jgi:hypothetical protein
VICTSAGDGEPVRDGTDRPVGDDPHGWRHQPGAWIEFGLEAPADVDEATLILDSAMHLDPQMSHWYPLHPKKLTRPPAEMPHTFRLEARVGDRWATVRRVQANNQRQVRIPVNARVSGLRYVLESTWGPCESTTLYGFYFG